MKRLTSGTSSAQATPSTACLYWARMSRSARVNMTSHRRNSSRAECSMSGLCRYSCSVRRIGRHERDVEDLEAAVLVGERLHCG